MTKRNRKRIGVIGFLHESNTFISSPTTYQAFENDCLLERDDFYRTMSQSNHETSGFFSVLDEVKDEFESIPIMLARAVPYGTITARAYRRIVDTMLSLLDEVSPIDGLLVAPHGATVSTEYPDADGYWLRTLRDFLGPNIPIIGTLDPHGNLSDLMAKSCNALIAYRSNPHLDQFEIGRQAASLLIETLKSEVKPVMEIARPPVAINIQKQETNMNPCLQLYSLADRQLNHPTVLTNSIMLGFPYSDVDEMGTAFIVVTDGDRSLAREYVDALAEYLTLHRRDFQAELEPMEETVKRCKSLIGPVCLLDMGDNTGGGGPADSTILLHECQRHGLTNTFVCLYDPAVVSQCMNLEIGSVQKIKVGAKTDELHGRPWIGLVKLIGKYGGKFYEPKARHGGATDCDQGPTVVVRHKSGITIMVTSKRQPPFSLRQLTSFDVDPLKFHILITKGVNAPIAAYKPICKQIVKVNTPGVTTADIEKLNYRHRRVPLYPFEDIL